jgi:sigma-E factor negative regulatory protein RseB
MRYFLLFVALTWQLIAFADADVKSWLMRMNEAANSLDYDGIYVHVNDNHIDSLRIVHKIKPEGVYERLYALNGIPREVIRDPQRVWCFIPDKSMGVLGARPGKDSGFPGFMVSKIEQLTDHYNLSVDGHDRIADRDATRIRILPQDALRYGYDLWADNETGLLLKTQLVDNSGVPVEQYLFVLLNIGSSIPDSALEPMTPKSELVWHQDKQPPRTTAIKESTWDIAKLPAGYRIIKMVHRWMPMEDNAVEQIVLSDGLGAVSVFIEPASGGDMSPSLDSMGAVSAFSQNRDGWQVTVIGEVPPETVQLIGEGLVRRQGSE